MYQMTTARHDVGSMLHFHTLWWGFSQDLTQTHTSPFCKTVRKQLLAPKSILQEILKVKMWPPQNIIKCIWDYMKRHSRNNANSVVSSLRCLKHTVCWITSKKSIDLTSHVVILWTIFSWIKMKFYTYVLYPSCSQSGGCAPLGAGRDITESGWMQQGISILSCSEGTVYNGLGATTSLCLQKPLHRHTWSTNRCQQKKDTDCTTVTKRQTTLLWGREILCVCVCTCYYIRRTSKPCTLCMFTFLSAC